MYPSHLAKHLSLNKRTGQGVDVDIRGVKFLSLARIGELTSGSGA